MTEIKDARFWDRIAPRYARDRIKDMHGYERSLSRLSDLIQGRDVLELGCGTGQSALHLAPSARQYLGTDISDGMITIARDRRAAAPAPNLTFRQGTATTLAAEEARYDVVLGLNYLHLVRDLPATLAHIHQMLRPDGLFVSKTACLAEMTRAIRLILPLMRLVGRAPHVAIFDTQGLQQALRRAGFQIDAVEHHASHGRDTRPFVIARKG